MYIGALIETILGNMSMNNLAQIHKQLKRTRGRHITFGLNGETCVVSRRSALKFVVSELAKRTAN